MAIHLGNDERSITVSALTNKIDGSLRDFGPLLIQGELSQIKIAASGHCYATLKDAEASISLVMWRSTKACHGKLPAEGSRGRGGARLLIRLRCRVVSTIWWRPTLPNSAIYTASLNCCEPGSWPKGCSISNEASLPCPEALALPGTASAALADMLSGLERRLLAYPSSMPLAKSRVLALPTALLVRFAPSDQHPQVELIIVGRGGGSLEDLWSFNEETTVRAIADCETPIISAVGHETDATLADLAADVRAKTPTAAIEEHIPLWDELVSELQDLQHHLAQLMEQRLAHSRQRLDHLLDHHVLAEPLPMW